MAGISPRCSGSSFHPEEWSSKMDRLVVCDKVRCRFLLDACCGGGGTWERVLGGGIF